MDGVPIGRAAWDTPIPVDGGERVVEATALDRSPWKTTVAVKREEDRVRVVVRAPAEPAPVVTAVAVPAGLPASNPLPAPAAPAPKGGARRATGIVLIGAGLAGLGAAAWLALDARSDYRNALKMCTGDVCPPEPYRRVQDARDQGSLATIVAIGGVAAALTGVTLWLWPSSGESADKATRLGVIPGGLSLSGSF
jgi:hypothetical protein